MSLDFLPFKGRLTEFAHQLWIPRLKGKRSILDATLGNGYDATLLVEKKDPEASFYGIDIQEKAIETTSKRLTSFMESATHVELRQGCHSNFLSLFPEITTLDFVCFNLGYLPGGDHQQTTTAKTTIQTLESILPLLESNGVISIMAYRGHKEGLTEFNEICQWVHVHPAKSIEAWTTGSDEKPGPCLILLEGLVPTKEK